MGLNKRLYSPSWPCMHCLYGVTCSGLWIFLVLLLPLYTSFQNKSGRSNTGLKDDVMRPLAYMVGTCTKLWLTTCIIVSVCRLSVSI